MYFECYGRRVNSPSAGRPDRLLFSRRFEPDPPHHYFPVKRALLSFSPGCPHRAGQLRVYKLRGWRRWSAGHCAARPNARYVEQCPVDCKIVGWLSLGCGCEPSLRMGEGALVTGHCLVREPCRWQQASGWSPVGPRANFRKGQ